MNISDKKIRSAMKLLVNDCIDHMTNEVNCTLLAEMTAEELNCYENDVDYQIPERLFEIAVEFG